MTLLEYIRDYNDITDKVRNRVKDPRTQVLEADQLPCDDVKYVDGEPQKIVFIDDNEDDYITVLALLCLSAEDVETSDIKGLKEVWHNYMDNIEIVDMTVQEIMSSAKLFYSKKLKERGELKDLLHNS